MAKYYRVIKDHPFWEVGAVISNEDRPNEYCADDLYEKDLGQKSIIWREGDAVVEHQPEWFERVYKVNVLKQVKYLSKEAARKANDELYKSK